MRCVGRSSNEGVMHLERKRTNRENLAIINVYPLVIFIASIKSEFPCCRHHLLSQMTQNKLSIKTQHPHSHTRCISELHSAIDQTDQSIIFTHYNFICIYFRIYDLHLQFIVSISSVSQPLALNLQHIMSILC